MGALVGSFAGTCAAGCCCTIATTGSVDSAKGARMLLVYLQAATLALTLLLAGQGVQLIRSQLCSLPGTSGVGICECSLQQGDVECWWRNVVHRSQCSGFMVFITLLCLAVSGCPKVAAHGLPGLKFILLPSLTLIFLFLPNDLFEFYAKFASVTSTVFIVAQAVLLIDFSYRWNEKWMADYRQAGLRNVRFGSMEGGWQKNGLLVVSLLLFAGSLGSAAVLWSSFEEGHWVIVLALILSIGFGVLSVLDWCEHGNLLTSCVVLAYGLFLCYKCLAAHPTADLDQPTFLRWSSFVVALISLLAAACGGSSHEEEVSNELELEGDSSEQPSLGRYEFLQHAGVHALANLYLTTELTVTQGMLSFVLRSFGLFASLLLYGWTLLAPKVLHNRQF